ncbi:TetR/AcrR family transcriptional regulator [Kaistia sp. UC242_56]|uniref:TetR/AcrR family transcriptional regulator n=1 Tax=Kaistia sp. UC242_56 TaxID=3374625 RepID=UPI00378A0DA5
MKVTRAQADENRARVIDVASRLFRQHGFDGIGIADVMKQAGLTHGGFYGNFKSKGDLAARASEHAFVTSRENWRGLDGMEPEAALEAIIRAYVSPQHRDSPDSGCALTALGPDAIRQEAGVRSVFGRGIRVYVEKLTSLVPGRSEAAKRQRALSTLSEMVGAVILARAADDPALSSEILEATLAHLAPGGAAEKPAA